MHLRFDLAPTVCLSNCDIVEFIVQSSEFLLRSSQLSLSCLSAVSLILSHTVGTQNTLSCFTYILHAREENQLGQTSDKILKVVFFSP